MKANESALKDRANGKISTPNQGPRSKAVGKGEIPKSSYPSRGIENPIK